MGTVTATTEVVSGELVSRPQPDDPGTDVEVHQASGVSSAIDRAAEAALTMPGVPGRDEFLSLAMQARVLSLSGAAPEPVRNNPHVAFHVAMVGRDLGISPSAALQLIDVIKTKNGYQLSLSPQLLNAQIRRLGLGAIRPVVQERDRCVAEAVAPDGTVLGETEFTWADAIDAGLVGPSCLPGQHKRNSDGRCPCNQGYRTYPRRMMWWRASGFCAADWFPEAGLGLYSPEELGAVVDDTGRPIDPGTVALPEGYNDPVEQQREQQAAADRPADAAKLWELQELIHALPEALRDELRDQWKLEECRVRGFAPHMLPQRLMGTARAMVNAKWAAANKAGIVQADELAALREHIGRLVTSLRWIGVAPAEAPQTPVTAPDPAPAPETPEPPVEAVTGDESGESEAVDWVPVLRDMAADVRAAIADTPADVAKRITDYVEGLHHTKVNAEIAAAELTGAYPPSCPIQLRRLVVTSIWLTAFDETGEVPAAEPSG